MRKSDSEKEMHSPKVTPVCPGPKLFLTQHFLPLERKPVKKENGEEGPLLLVRSKGWGSQGLASKLPGDPG